MEKHKLPQRKKIRLKNCDYSGGSSYFVTICLKKTTDLFLWDKEKTEKWIEFSSPVFLVDTSDAKENSTSDYDVVFENLPLSEVGLTVKRQIEKIAEVYRDVTVPFYVIMANHIHLLVDNYNFEDKISLSRVIGNFKRAVSRELGVSIWQKSFYESVLSTEQRYNDAFDYIYYNPFFSLVRTPYIQKLIAEDEENNKRI